MRSHFNLQIIQKLFSPSDELSRVFHLHFYERFVKCILQPKSGGVIERTPEFRTAARQKAAKSYFHGARGKLYPHSFDVKISDGSFLEELFVSGGIVRFWRNCSFLGRLSFDWAIVGVECRIDAIYHSAVSLIVVFLRQ